MSAADHPIQICDHEDGCDQWRLDVWPTGGRYVNPSDDPLSDWQVDRSRDLAYCPDHTPGGSDRDR